jgi:hypothetical protein
MRSSLRRLAIMIAITMVGVVILPVASASANTIGDSLYTTAGDGVTYARVIRLAHAGDANGRLLATFEYDAPGTTEPADVQIRESRDDGQTWSTIAQVPDGMTGPGHPATNVYQPFLFELPQQVGGYPAGTLLLTANMIGSDNSTNFQLWRSSDHGVSWDFVSMYQYARNADQNGNEPGIWEPFLTLNGDGDLVAYFADERQQPAYSQFVGHIVSNDGGDTWSANPDGSTNYAPGLVKDVATTATQRPGMPTVTRLPDGTFVLGYEICASSRGACEAYLKKSTDGGKTWGSGPTDPGTFVQTTDGRYLGSSPYVTWSPGGGPDGQLLMAGMRTRRVADNSFAPEDYESVFVNTNNGDGPWSWFPAPLQIQAPAGPDNGLANYSPSLLPSVDGTEVRYTAPSYTDPKSERTHSANAGVLPYAAPWAESESGWKHYGGTWQLTDGALTESSGGAGHKSIAGSTGWTDYVLQADVRLAASTGHAGLLFRVSDPAVGTDALKGYFVAIGGGLQLGRMNHNWTSLASAPIEGGVAPGTWYRVRVEVEGCTFTITATPAAGGDPTTLSHTDSGCHAAGSVGLRNFGTAASWRNLTVQPR